MTIFVLLEDYVVVVIPLHAFSFTITHIYMYIHIQRIAGYTQYYCS